jgi:hypothetical protein
MLKWKHVLARCLNMTSDELEHEALLYDQNLNCFQLFSNICKVENLLAFVQEEIHCNFCHNLVDSPFIEKNGVNWCSQCYANDILCEKKLM